jgi:hypothetical protein
VVEVNAGSLLSALVACLSWLFSLSLLGKVLTTHFSLTVHHIRNRWVSKVPLALGTE